MRTLIFAYTLRIADQRLKYDVVPGIPGVEDMTVMDLTLWFQRVVPRLKESIPKAVVGVDSNDMNLVETRFVESVSQTIDKSFSPARVVVMRAEAVANMINNGVTDP